MHKRLHSAEPKLSKLQEATAQNSELNPEISRISKSHHIATKQLQDSVDNLQRLYLDLEEIEVAMETCQHGIETVNQKLSVTSATDIKDLDRTLKVRRIIYVSLYKLCVLITYQRSLKLNLSSDFLVIWAFFGGFTREIFLESY